MNSPQKSHSSSRHAVSAVLAATLVFALTGCARSPSFNVLGSYFPGWIACMVASILLTALVRFVLNRLRWEQQVPALPLFYFSHRTAHRLLNLADRVRVKRKRRFA